MGSLLHKTIHARREMNQIAVRIRSGPELTAANPARKSAANPVHFLEDRTYIFMQLAYVSLA